MGGGGHSSCLESLREESGLITCSPPAPSHCHCLPAMVMVGGRKCPQLSNFSQRSPPFGPYCPLPLPFHFLSWPFSASPKLFLRHSTPPITIAMYCTHPVCFASVCFLLSMQVCACHFRNRTTHYKSSTPELGPASFAAGRCNSRPPCQYLPF